MSNILTNKNFDKTASTLGVANFKSQDFMTRQVMNSRVFNPALQAHSGFGFSQKMSDNFENVNNRSKYKYLIYAIIAVIIIILI